jgi:3-hydroxyacyl-CoA dehydrogenase
LLVRKIIEAASQRRGITRQSLNPEDIQRRAILSMVNEAALLMSEGVAQRTSDIDVVLVHGYGFPRWRGGPVFWARQQDPIQLQKDISQLAQHGDAAFVLSDTSILFEKS